MSTGADAKTMPGNVEFREGFDHTFGEQSDADRIERARSSRRGVFVSRCSNCDGVDLSGVTFRYDCPKCGGKDCKGSVDVSIAPPLESENAISAPIMVDRFMEGAVATDGTDIGSRRKRKDYMRATGAADRSDYGPGYGERVRAARERAVSESTKQTLAEVSRLDPRHLRKYMEEK
jgi:hypothetical protein